MALVWIVLSLVQFGEVAIPAVSETSTPEEVTAAKKAEEEDNKLVPSRFTLIFCSWLKVVATPL